MTDIPLSLKSARTEVLRALAADSAQEEIEHRKLAEDLVREAVRELASNATGSHDWSVLNPDEAVAPEHPIQQRQAFADE